MLILISLVILQSSNSYRNLLAHVLVGRTRVACFPILRSSTSPSNTDSEAMIRADNAIIRRDVIGNAVYFVWDSSQLLPQGDGMVTYDKRFATLKGFEDLLARNPQSKTLEQLCSPEGIQGVALDRAQRAKLSELLDSGQASREKLDAGEGKFTVSLQPRILFFDKAGQLVAEANFKNCPHAIASLSELFRKGQGEALRSRIPADVAHRILPGRAVPLSVKDEYTVAEVIKIAFGDHPVGVEIDRRVLAKRILYASKGEELDAHQLVEGVMQSLDLYWRPVGSIWFLGASPGSPDEEVFRRSQLKAVRATAGFYEQLGQAGLMGTTLLADEFDDGRKPLGGLSAESM